MSDCWSYVDYKKNKLSVNPIDILNHKICISIQDENHGQFCRVILTASQAKEMVRELNFMAQLAEDTNEKKLERYFDK